MLARLANLAMAAVLIAPQVMAQDLPRPSHSGTPHVSAGDTPPPMPAAEGSCQIDLAGSVWSGRMEWKNGDKLDWWLQFRKDGVLAYAYRGMVFENGHWRQDGQSISFDMNNHYADYSGAVSLTELQGTMKNVWPDAGQWHVSRSCQSDHQLLG